MNLIWYYVTSRPPAPHPTPPMKVAQLTSRAASILISVCSLTCSCSETSWEVVLDEFRVFTSCSSSSNEPWAVWSSLKDIIISIKPNSSNESRRKLVIVQTVNLIWQFGAVWKTIRHYYQYQAKVKQRESLKFGDSSNSQSRFGSSDAVWKTILSVSVPCYI